MLGSPTAVIAAVWAAVMTPPPPVDLNAWAAANVVFGSESPLPGPYRPDLFPMNRRILEVLGPDHPAREVVLCKAAQGGGTVLAQIFVGGSLDLDPGPILYVTPTESNAERWSKTKWGPFIRGCARLRSLLPTATSREARNSTLYQERRDGRGYLQISGASSEASLSMVSMPRQVQDDLAKWEVNSAGDPETQANSRSKAFDDAKIFKIGTPLLEDGCRITRAFKRGTQEHWHVPCPHCGHRHALEWENMLAGLDEARPELAHFSCPACGGVIEERHRADIMSRGEWVAHNPAAGPAVISLTYWSAHFPTERWENIARAWFAAKGDPAAEQAFHNDVLGRAYASAGEAPPWEELQRRATASERRPGVVPPGGLLLTMGLDCQDDRVEWQLVAWGRELRRWVVQYGVVAGSITDKRTHARLDDLVRGLWPDFQGGQRPVDLLAIDGNAWTEDVFDWARRHPESRVIMVRGTRGDLAPVMAKVRRERSREGQLKRYQRRFFNVGVSPLKLALYANLKKTDPLERGHVSFPAELDGAYFVGLTVERRMQVRRRDGTVEWRWVNPQGQANEPLDTMLYAEAAAIRLGYRTLTDGQWQRLERERETPPRSAQLDLEDLSLGLAGADLVQPMAPLDADANDLPEAADEPPTDSATASIAATSDDPPKRADILLGRVGRRPGLVGRFRI